MKLDKKHLEIAKVLVEEIKYNQNIFYIDLRRKVGMGENEMEKLWRYLGELSYFSFKNNMPLISAMVINKRTYLPGGKEEGGFYGVYENLRGIRVKDKKKVFDKEWELIKEYDNWNRLIELLEEEINPKQKLILPQPKFKLKDKRKLLSDRLRINNLKNTEVEFEEINEFINIDEVELEEGEYIERFIKTKKRNGNARELKLRQFKQDNNGQVFCEVCKEDDIAVIDIHHNLIEISKMEGVHKTKLSDLRVLCSNCHRKVHYYEKNVEDLIEECNK